MRQQNRSLKCASINARSLVNKTPEFMAWVDTNCCDIIAVTETWLDDSLLDSELLPSNYNIERRDRDRHGGGVMLACRDNLALVRRKDCGVLCLECIIVHHQLVAITWRRYQNHCRLFPSIELDQLCCWEISMLLELIGINVYPPQHPQ